METEEFEPWVPLRLMDEIDTSDGSRVSGLFAIFSDTEQHAHVCARVHLAALLHYFEAQEMPPRG